MRLRSIMGKELFIPETDTDKYMILMLESTGVFKFKRHDFELGNRIITVYEVIQD